VFIVSPHHSQIRLIRRALQSQRQEAWTSPPFVDTVDKMQGQEAEAVIVSYGVSDPEFALQEAIFIYGQARLNVAMTRARTKTILFLTRALLDATPQVIETSEAEEGVRFMRSLFHSLATQAPLDFSLKGGVGLRLYCSGAKPLPE
jgi:DNA replication ATP-dependent helicase Dna2